MCSLAEAALSVPQLIKTVVQVQEGTRYGVISSKKWHIFVAREGGPKSRAVKFSRTFACDDPAFPVRSLYLYMLHLAAQEPWLDPALRPITPSERKWLQKGEAAVHAEAVAAATSGSSPPSGDDTRFSQFSFLAVFAAFHVQPGHVAPCKELRQDHSVSAYVSRALQVSTSMCDWHQAETLLSAGNGHELLFALQPPLAYS